jgi:hypothetical protein
VSCQPDTVAIVPGHAFSDRALDRQFNPTHLVNYRRTRHPRSCSGQYRNRTCQSGARTSPSVPDNSPCAKATATARARRLARWGCLYGRRRRARGNSTRIYLHQTLVRRPEHAGPKSSPMRLGWVVAGLQHTHFFVQSRPEAAKKQGS